MLHKIADGIRNANIASYLEVVESAKVPIVKFDHVTYGISVDIVYNNLSGLSTGKMMKKYVREYPPLRPLALFLKIFLVNNYILSLCISLYCTYKYLYMTLYLITYHIHRHKEN
jgi:DNA polymerase sigma